MALTSHALVLTNSDGHKDVFYQMDWKSLSFAADYCLSYILHHPNYQAILRRFHTELLHALTVTKVQTKETSAEEGSGDDVADVPEPTDTTDNNTYLSANLETSDDWLEVCE